MKKLILVCALILAGCGPTRDEIDCSAFVGDAWDAEELNLEEQRMLDRINEFRGNGLTCNGTYMEAVDPVESDDALTCAARMHAQDMLERDYFAHISPEGEDPADRAVVTGFTGRALSENISCGRPDGQETTDALSQSTSGHCENIMDPDAELVGVGGMTGGPTESNSWTHCWVQLFAE